MSDVEGRLIPRPFGEGQQSSLARHAGPLAVALTKCGREKALNNQGVPSGRRNLPRVKPSWPHEDIVLILRKVSSVSE
jgi:hypothetical protein